jgi:hypothetical protein
MRSKGGAKEIVENSGNNFHFKVVNLLRNKNWTVSVSPYYNDHFTHKPREIDIIAERLFPVTRGHERIQGVLNIKLFIECKYITSCTVFWFDERDRERAIDRIVRDTSLKPPEESSLIDRHRYLSKNTVAKLFQSGKSEEQEPIYKALTQSLNAMVYYRKSPPIIHKRMLENKRIVETVSFPVIICNNFNNFFRVDGRIPGNIEEIKENFHLEVHYAYIQRDGKDMNEYFLIDVISFENIEDFLTDLFENSIESIKSAALYRLQQNAR